MEEPHCYPAISSPWPLTIFERADNYGVTAGSSPFGALWRATTLTARSTISFPPVQDPLGHCGGRGHE